MSLELDVSPLLDEDCGLLSGSQWELGPDAGKITWANCIKLADRFPLVTDANRQDIRDHFRGYGAWDADEIEAWDDTELSAMVWQEGAAAYRELDEHGADEGRVYLSDDGTKLFLYLGM